MMKNVMLDLETMGTTSRSAIVAIGAVKFDKDLGIVDKFYEVVDLQSCIDRGFELSGGTISWWLTQSDSARNELVKPGRIPIRDALKKFQAWLPKENLQLWGNGSDFDNVILTNAFQKFNVEKPWPHYSNRCFRTIKYSFTTVAGVDAVGVAHNAVNDAEYQANYLIALYNANKEALKHLI